MLIAALCWDKATLPGAEGSYYLVDSKKLRSSPMLLERNSMHAQALERMVL